MMENPTVPTVIYPLPEEKTNQNNNKKNPQNPKQNNLTKLNKNPNN